MIVWNKAQILRFFYGLEVKEVTEQKKAFAKLVSEGMTHTDAWIKVHPHSKATTATAARKAHDWVHEPAVEAYIEELKEKRAAKAEKQYDITKDKVIEELAKIAFSDIGDVIEVDNEEKLNFITLKKNANTKAVQEIKTDMRGNIVVKMCDKVSAIEKLADLLGYNQKEMNVNLSGSMDIEFKGVLDEWSK